MNAPLPPKGGECEEIGFAQFWAAYPKNLNRLRAETAWKHLTAEEKTAAIAALPRACKAAEWNRDDGQFIPQAAKWLHRKCWQDDPKADYTPRKPKPAAPPPPPAPLWLGPLNRVRTIRNNKPDPATLETFEWLRIAGVLESLPPEGWSDLTPEEYNYFKPIWREHDEGKKQRSQTIEATEPSRPEPKSQ